MPRTRERAEVCAFMVLALPGLVACAGDPAQVARMETPDLPRHEMIFAHHSDAGRTDYDVWRMCGDGTQMASLVVEPGRQLQLSVSPDGSEFVYSSRIDGRQDIWRRGFGPGEPVNLTDSPAVDSEPAWSPDGQLLAFFSDRDAASPELYLMDLGDGRIERLTANEFHDSGGAWSPDGSAILFTRYFPDPDRGEHEGDGEIMRLDLATREETQLTHLGGYNGGASWSPHGHGIAFHRVAGERSEIWLMGEDGSNPRALTDTFIDEYTPQWSPEGNWISFTAGVGNDSQGTFDIWLMRPDGSGRQVLGKSANTEGWQRWRPGDHHCR